MRRAVWPAIVVGSGPAGVACCAALAASGIRPLVVDGGNRLDDRRAGVVESLAAVEPSEWDPEVIGELRRSFPVDVDALPLKPVSGSLFPYAADVRTASVRTHGVGAVPSLAIGGLSNAWGGAMLPWSEHEHKGWPIRARDLAPHYRAVLRFVPLAGEVDALAEHYPLHADRPGHLRPTRQIQALLDDVRGATSALGAAGVIAGRARLAVHTEGSHSCRYAGACMLGCPYGSIWNAARTLQGLVASKQVEHRPGAIVESFAESPAHVSVTFANENGEVEELRAERLFVAAGPLATARLVLASTERDDKAVRLQDSAYFTLPLLRMRRPRRSPEPVGNVLAQLFLELSPPWSSEHRVHMQLYGYNDLMRRAVAARLRLSEGAAARLAAPVLGRLLYLQGYLHSGDSPALTATLVDEGGRRILAVEGEAPDRSRPRAAVSCLLSLRRELGLLPLTSLLQAWPPGKGFHIGASLPMRSRPAGLETDLLGRPAGFRRIHVVDASVLPAIPAQTVTLPTMANAHRIASYAFDS